MILKNLIYIYQLENYNKKRFLFFVYRNLNWFSLNKRGELDWTMRAKLIFIISIVVYIIIIGIFAYSGGLCGFLLGIIFSLISLPLYTILSDVLILPLVLFQKNKISNQAKKIIQSMKKDGLITIGITGSFGKTSMKNVLVSILNKKYKIFTFPGNINTDMGVAQYLIKNKSKIAKTDILISEMGAYQKGDIEKLCDIIKPDYSITTSIGESHLERFGSLKNVILAKFELANATREKIFLNFCDKNIKDYAKLNIFNKIEINKICGRKDVTEIKYLENYKGISFKYRDQVFETRVVANYIIDFAVIAFAVAKELKLNELEMQNGLKNLKFTPHRLEVIKNKKLNRVIIDDSYNGNYAGFLAGLSVLNKARGRKIVLTPGIVELGDKSREIHFRLAKKYIKSVDLVLLIVNRNTDFIVDKFKELGYNNFKVYETVEEAHADLENILRNEDTIIFQNDVTDNYL